VFLLRPPRGAPLQRITAEARIFHQWSVARVFQGGSSVAFATDERAGVLDRYVEHSDRVKTTEGVLWGAAAGALVKYPG
jgi:hypothetical protein